MNKFIQVSLIYRRIVMKNFSVRFILLFAILGFYVNIVYAEDIKMYDDYGRYTGVMKETSSGYRMYDSSGRYTGEMKRTSNGYRTYDSSSRYTGSLKETSNGYNNYDSKGRYTGSYKK